MTVFERVAAYATGTLDEIAAEELERALFFDPQLADAAADVLAIVDGLLELAQRGPLVPILTPAELTAWTAIGRKVVEGYPQDDRVAVEIGAAEFVAAHLPVDLHDAARIDVAISKPDGPPYFTTRDAPFDPVTGELVLLCSSHLARVASPIRVTITDETQRTRGVFILDITAERSPSPES